MSAGNLDGFDAGQVEPTSFDVLPAGRYEVAIVNSSIKTTKEGNGRYLELELQVLNGECQNRVTWDRLNLWNPSDKAVQIARGTLSSICRAIGVMTPKDSTELHNKPLVAKVVVKKSDEFGESNDVKGYYPRNAKPAAATATAAPEANGGGNPW